MLNYLAQTLSPSEKLLYRGRIHPVFKLRIWALFFVLVALIGWAGLTFPNQFTWPYAIASGILAAVLCVRAILPLWTLEIGLTDNRVIIKHGFIAYSSQELELKTIEEVNVTQSLPGRVFGYGTIQIRGIGIDTIVLKRVADPLKFRRAIESALRNIAVATTTSYNVQRVKAL
jgi:uncharacterized membrane protein YdbT with pleckstrin-like domain